MPISPAKKKAASKVRRSTRGPKRAAVRNSARSVKRHGSRVAVHPRTPAARGRTSKVKKQSKPGKRRAAKTARRPAAAKKFHRVKRPAIAATTRRNSRARRDASTTSKKTAVHRVRTVAKSPVRPAALDGCGGSLKMKRHKPRGVATQPLPAEEVFELDRSISRRGSKYFEYYMKEPSDGLYDFIVRGC